MIQRRHLPFLATGLLATPALAQTVAWPSRPLRLVVPFPPGGVSDIMARLMAQALQDALGQPVVADNRGGAGGAVGTAWGQSQAPDGYTLVLANPATHATAPLLYPNAGYDGVSDVQPVAGFATIASIAVVHPSVPATSIAELVAHARANPGRLNFGSAGAGGSIHLAGELFRIRTGVEIVHVPYRGGAAMLTELLAGRVQIAFDNFPQIIQHVRRGEVRGLAVTSRERSPFEPALPTMIEAGVPEFDITSWFGLTAPRGTPEPVVARLNAVLRAAVAEPALRERLAGMGALPLSQSPEAFGAFLRAERARYAEIIRVSGARVD